MRWQMIIQCITLEPIATYHTLCKEELDNLCKTCVPWYSCSILYFNFLYYTTPRSGKKEKTHRRRKASIITNVQFYEAVVTLVRLQITECTSLFSSVYVLVWMATILLWCDSAEWNVSTQDTMYYITFTYGCRQVQHTNCNPYGGVHLIC